MSTVTADIRLAEMDTTKRFKIGNYLVEPELDRISLNGQVSSVRPQVMELLVYLARRPGRVFSADELIAELWPRKVVTNASLYNCVAELRRALGGNGDRPSLIETIPKRGYRLIGEVSGLEPLRIGKGKRRRRGIPAKRLAYTYTPALILVVLVTAYFAFDHLFDDETPASIPLENPQPFIAVLPFKDLSPEGDQAYFSEGIAEELINSLAQVRGLKVASRSTSFALAESGLGGLQMTGELNLTHLLEGSVRKEGNRVRITAQLIDARSSAHLFSSTYDRRLDDAFAVQREISEQVVKELEIRIVEPVRAVATPHPKALELVLQGRHLLSERRLEALKRAEGLFTEASEIDPEYADAYAGLAKSLALRRGIHEWGKLQLITLARVALDRALEIDPYNSNALATYGLLLANSDAEAAKRFYQRAIESNPSNSDAYRWLALRCEQTEPLRYLESIHKAYLVDPLNHPLNFHRVVSLLRFGLYEEALAAIRDWRRLNPGAPGPHLLAGRIHFWHGDFDEALSSYYTAYRINPHWRVVAIQISEFFAEMNELELADDWLTMGQGDESGSENEGRLNMIQRTVLAQLGGQQEAVSTLLSQVQEQNPYWSFDLGRALVLAKHDFGAARAAWDRGLMEMGWNRLQDWGAPNLVDYSLVLKRTGANDKATELFDEAESLIETQLAAGMVSYGEWETYQAGVKFYAAALYVMRGEKDRALELLADDGSNWSRSCMRCLKTWPHFDALRGNPGFDALLVRIDTERTAQSQHLANRGLLLTPEEVLALEDSNFYTYEGSDVGSE